MIRYKQLVTFKVMNKENGELIGKVLDLVYSDNYKRITHLVVKNNNLIKNKAPISYEDIHFSEDNQILYLSNDKIFEDKLEEDIKEDFKYMEKEIRFENGECIGYVKDLAINIESGFIEGFIVTEGVFEDLIKGRNYIPFSENIIVKEDCIYIFSNNLN